MKYLVTLVEKVTYEIEVEAVDKDQAEELAFDVKSEDYITDSDIISETIEEVYTSA